MVSHAIALAILSVSLAFSQASTATLDGVIHDPSGAVVPGARVIVTNTQTGVNTTVTSYGGLSGIDVYQNNMFLVGVFLDANEPSGPGPAVLSYNYGTPGSLSTSDPSFSPALDQVFFIGDGLTGTGTGQEQIFHVPAGADRLYLGFADSFDSGCNRAAAADGIVPIASSESAADSGEDCAPGCAFGDSVLRKRRSRIARNVFAILYPQSSFRITAHPR